MRVVHARPKSISQHLTYPTSSFNINSRRGNYEEKNELMINWNDPMQLKDGERHDWFPKEDLTNAGWLGDRYPLCSDLPDKAFLKTGATFK